MAPGVLQNVSLFLADVLLSLYAIVFIVRFLLMLAQADFYNPISQAVVKLTQVPVNVAHKFIPPVRKADLACLVIAWALKALELFLVGVIQEQAWPAPALFAVALIQIAETLIYVHIFALIILAISSWFMSGVQAFNHPLISLLYSLTAPLLTPIRRWIPPIGALDLSPLAALIVLYLLLTVLRSFY